MPFATVCFRWRPAALADRTDEPALAARLDEANAAIMDAVNRSGEVFLSHTRLGRPVHDPRLRSATCGRRPGTSIVPGSCSGLAAAEQHVVDHRVEA